MPKQADRRKLLLRLAPYQDGLCFHCRKPMLMPEDHDGRFSNHEGNEPERASLDHIVSRNGGGRDGTANLVVACRECNSRRGHRDPTQDELSRLAELNTSRHDELVRRPGFIDYNSFGPATPATDYLIDLLNAADGAEGNRLRGQVGKRMTALIIGFNHLEAVRDHGFHGRMARLLLDQSLGLLRVSKIEEPLQSLAANVMTGMYRRRISARHAQARRQQSESAQARRQASLARFRNREQAVSGT